jgi:hypothetical protein
MRVAAKFGFVFITNKLPWISSGYRFLVSVFEGKFSFGTKTYRGDSSIFFKFFSASLCQPILFTCVI